MTPGARRWTAGLCAAALAVLAAATGWQPPRGGSIDGSCAEGRSRVVSIDGRTGTVTWSRLLQHPREDRPQATRAAVLVHGCGIVVLAAEDGRSLYRQRSEHGVVGLAGSSLVTRAGDDGLDVAVTSPGDDGADRLSSTPPYDLVTVAGDDLVVGLDGRLSAYGMPPAGQPRWETSFAGATSDATLTEAAGVLLVHTGDGSLYRVAPATGQVAWRVIPGPPALGYGPVLAHDGTTAVVDSGLERDDDGGRTVVGLDLAHGAQLWRVRVGREASGSGGAVIVEGVVVLPTETADGRELVALDLANGRVLWRRPGDAGGPAAAGDVVVVGDAAAAVALDPRTGAECWRVATQNQPLLAGVPGTDQVVVLDSPPVAHGSDDCC